LAEHYESRRGDLIMADHSGHRAVQDFINSALLGILVNVLTIAGILGVMFWVNWRLTLLALSILRCSSASCPSTRGGSKAASRAVRKREGELVSSMAEVLSSIHVVQAFAREDYETGGRVGESGDRGNRTSGAEHQGEAVADRPASSSRWGPAWCWAMEDVWPLAGELSAGVLIVFLLYLGKLVQADARSVRR